MYSDFLTPLEISLKTTITATIITFCLGVLTAWWMRGYQGQAKSILETIFTAPLVLPPTVVGFLLLLALGRNGWIGQLLDLVGIRVVFTWYATVIAGTVVAFPLMYKFALGGFEQVDDNLIDCARTLGASEKTIFWQIILPLAKPSLITGTLLAFARALGEFGATLMLAGSIPGKTQTIPMAIYLAAESGAMNQALGLVLVLLTISLGILLAISYENRRKNPKRQPNRTSSQHPLWRKSHRGRSTKKNNHPTTSNHSVYLVVNIQKQLPDFLLDIAFEIDISQNPLGILGVSGAGKTTLLRCIAGLATPDRGVIMLNHQILFDSVKGINLPPQEREVGLVWQDYALFPHLTVGENIAFGMASNQSNLIVESEIDRQLQQVELGAMKHRLPQQLSGGEKQRVALARAFASEPQLTLLDEPCSALDTDLKVRLLQLLHQRLSSYQGLTLYVTHNLREAYDLCPQLLVIDGGKAIAFGERQTIFNYPPNLPTARLIGCQNFSLAKRITPQKIQALDWQCSLQVEHPIPPTLAHIAIHPHHLSFVEGAEGVNIFPVWLTNFRELTDRMMLNLKLHSAPRNLQDYHLITEVNLAEWQELQQLGTPWYLQLDPGRIIFLNQQS
jgi:molybdate transport system permease protein